MAGMKCSVPRAWQQRKVSMENFEQKLSRLEQLSEAIKQSDISLEDAIKDFEEGIKLARSMQAYLDEMEGKVQILMNPQEATEGGKAGGIKRGKAAKGATTTSKEGEAAAAQDAPVLGLFDETSEIRGTRT